MWILTVEISLRYFGGIFCYYFVFFCYWRLNRRQSPLSYVHFPFYFYSETGSHQVVTFPKLVKLVISLPCPPNVMGLKT